jgi:hypothetical protein
MDKTSKIYKVFEKYGIDPNIYVTCGTSGGRIVNGEVKNMTGSLYYKKCYPNSAIPELKSHCICGIKIIENCYVTTPDYNPNNIVVVGNCCFKEFFKNKVTFCLICNESHTNGIFDNKGLCDSCKIIKKSKLRELSKEFKMLVKKHEYSLNCIIQQETYELNNIKEKYDLLRKKIEKYENLKKTGKLEQYITSKIIKKNSILFNQYRELLEIELEELNYIYNPVFNGFKLLNKFAKICKKNNRKIRFKYCNDYNIACLYENYKHVYTMNLNTGRPTKNSPSQKLVNLAPLEVRLSEL